MRPYSANSVPKSTKDGGSTVKRRCGRRETDCGLRKKRTTRGGQQRGENVQAWRRRVSRSLIFNHFCRTTWHLGSHHLHQMRFLRPHRGVKLDIEPHSPPSQVRVPVLKRPGQYGEPLPFL